MQILELLGEIYERKLRNDLCHAKLMVLNTTNSNSLTPEAILDFLIGTGVTVENIKITGAKEAIGSFSGGISEGIGIEEGVILSSGNIADAAGPNDSDNTGQALGQPGDQDLDALLENSNTTNTTNDAVVLEFDFTPENEQFLFEYVFASEEYNEFANSSFNDIFAFFLNEENIALIPGTTTPVAINNINATENSAFFRNNDRDDITGELPFNTEFDGFTTILAARGFVTPGQTQHLKIVIADTTDGIYDSAVFLKAGSLSTLPPSPDARLTVDPKDIFSIEGSPGFATLQFTLSGVNKDFINVDEVGVFVVDDDQGRIAGVAPGQEDYEKLALTGVRSKAIFTGLSRTISEGGSQTRLLNFDAGDKLGFYVVANGTTDMVVSDTPGSIYQKPPQVFFAFPEENPDGSDHLQVTDNGGVFTLAWEDSLTDADFNDLVLNMEVVQPARSLPLASRRQGEIQKEIIDLSGLEEGAKVTANINITSHAVLDNTVGLYPIEDPQGTIIDPLTGSKLVPSDEGYAVAAIRQRIVEFDKNGGGSVELADGFYAPFLIVNNTAEQWLVENPNNFPLLDTFAYFPFLSANGGSFDFEHIALLGDNTFGFEDLRIAESDFDFDDMIMQINF